MRRRSLVQVAVLGSSLSLLFGCMTFETTMPGVLDMRAELAKPQDAPVEPKRPAFGDMDDSYFEGFVLTEATDQPTQGEYVKPTQAKVGEWATPAKPADAEIYRRVLRQWFIIGLFPILADPAAVTTDLKAELATPGTRITNVRVTSGMDLIDFGRAVVAQLFSWTGIVGLLSLVPTRTTEVIAYVERAPASPQALPSPVAPPSPAIPPTPVAPPPGPTPTGPVPSQPDAPLAPSSGGSY
ncbi:MAG: hypothetical protein ABIJ09_09140 [Pseudomonadota bacterium]